VIHDIDEGITFLPMDLSGVKSEDNVGGNHLSLCHEFLTRWNVTHGIPAFVIPMS
jgi:hypothetical protein